MVLLPEHQPPEEHPVPLGQQVRRSGQQTASDNGQHPHSSSDPFELQDVSAEKQSTFHSTVEAGTGPSSLFSEASAKGEPAWKLEPMVMAKSKILHRRK